MSDIHSFRRLIEKVSAEAEVYQIDLPIKSTELSPVFSKGAIDLHYGTLYKNYVKKALDGDGEFQVAGAKLHTLFFEQFQKPKASNNPFGASLILIEKEYGSFDQLKEKIKESALSIQGSGWVYLSTNGSIKTIANHKVVKDIALIIDMWEHSYLPDYSANKEKYLKEIWKIINWNTINARLN